MKLIDSKKIREALGDTNRQDLDRIRRDPSLNFPKAVLIRGKLLWDADEFETWVRSRPKVTALPSRKQKANSKRAASVLTEHLERAA